MKISTLLIVGLTFLVAAAIITPPDLISQIIVIFEMLIVCGLLAFIISRFKSFKQTPESIKKLIIVMVCFLSITISYSVTLFLYCHQKMAVNRNLSTEQSEIVDSEDM